MLTPFILALDFRKSNGSDIIQLLVSIYDTKDVFVKELQILLAQRLLAVKNYDLDREVRETLSFTMAIVSDHI